MALLIGATLALAVGMFATATRFERDRAFYPTVMIVIAAYYLLFAVIGASPQALLVELLYASIFIAGAVWSFKRSLWIVVAALASHGMFDLLHDKLIANPGVPDWWPYFCLTYDVTAGVYLGLLIRSGRIAARDAGRAELHFHPSFQPVISTRHRAEVLTASATQKS